MVCEATNKLQYYSIEVIKNKALRRKKIMKDYENRVRLPKPIIFTSVDTDPAFAGRQNFT